MESSLSIGRVKGNLIRPLPLIPGMALYQVDNDSATPGCNPSIVQVVWTLNDYGVMHVLWVIYIYVYGCKAKEWRDQNICTGQEDRGMYRPDAGCMT